MARPFDTLSAVGAQDAGARVIDGFMFTLTILITLSLAVGLD